MLRIGLIALIVIYGAALPVVAQNRLALVIGNDSYSDVPALRKAVNDANSMAATLASQNFEVFAATDADRRTMNRNISQFTAKLEPGDTAFLFFAGHGVEIDGENYLLPVDIITPAAGEQDFIKAESIALSSLLDRIRSTGAKVTIAMIDACRDNPFAMTTGRSIGRTRGLGRIAAPEGTFVIFSAGAGQMALDELVENEPEKNSVFTRTLLPKLTKPGLELRDLIKEVRLEVRNSARSVNHAQFPAYYDELLGEFYFAGVRPAAMEAAPASEPALQPVRDDIQDDFAIALQTGTSEALEAFLSDYANTNPDAPSVTAARELLVAKHAARQDEQLSARSSTAEAEVVFNEREHVRAVQRELNRLGCHVGTADGLAGAKTRGAFAQVIGKAGLALGPGDLNNPGTLTILSNLAAPVCEQVVVAKRAEPEPPSSPKAPEPPAGIDISGVWDIKASCPLFIRTTGVITIERAGDNRYTGFLTDSLDQQATSVLVVDGLDIETSDDFGWITTTANMRLAPDGNSASGSTSTFCDVEWQKAG